MSYIGRKPTVGNFQICDAISVVNNQAAYTMQVGSVNVLPETANHMIVSLNGVIQAPISSYTVSGSTITFASNLVTGDVINFIQILGDVLDLGVPSDATVTTAKLSSNSVTTAKINNDAVTVDKLNLISTGSVPSLEAKGTSGVTEGYIQLNCAENTHGIKIKSPPHSASASYTLTMPNNDGDANQFLQTNGSGVLSFASAGGDNRPYFAATAASSGTLTDNTWVKVQFTGEKVDSDGKYDASNAKFTPTVAGWYVCSIRVLFYNGTDDMRSQSNVAFYKNGSNEGNNNSNSYRNGGGLFYFTTPQKTALIYLDDNDYLEGYARPNAVDNGTAYDGSACEFSAWKLI